MTSKILYDLDQDVATITLNDPGALNALGLEMLEGLRCAIARAAREARCTILTGAGRGFCAGANLTSGGMRPSDPEFDAGLVLDSHYHPVIESIRNHPHPFINAVNGVAAGAGCSLALMGDMIFASKEAYFLQAFRRIGLVPDAGSSYLLARTIGRVRAMEMALLGEKLPADKALEWGLINAVVEDTALMDHVKSIAQKLATGPTKALAATRQLVWNAQEDVLGDALGGERDAQRDAGRTNDFREGVAAFAQKRSAQFTGS